MLYVREKVFGYLELSYLGIQPYLHTLRYSAYILQSPGLQFCLYIKMYGYFTVCDIWNIWGLSNIVYLFSTVRILGNCHISFMEIKWRALRTWLSCDFRRDSVFSQGRSCTDYDDFFDVLLLYETVVVYLELPFAWWKYNYYFSITWFIGVFHVMFLLFEKKREH